MDQRIVRAGVIDVAQFHEDGQTAVPVPGLGTRDIDRLRVVVRRLQGPVVTRPPDLDFGAGDNPFDFESNTGTVQVISGPMIDELDFVGMTVGEAYTQLRDAYHLAPDATATLNGEEADAGMRLSRGDTLEFVRATGEKGAA